MERHRRCEADPRWTSVPAGYRTDFASIPRPIPWPLWPLLPPVGRSGKAAVIHDWLSENGPDKPADRRVS